MTFIGHMLLGAVVIFGISAAATTVLLLLRSFGEQILTGLLLLAVLIGGPLACADLGKTVAQHFTQARP
jgi:hypothetical protein